MRACAELRVLFRAAAGSRRGFGHLVRCRSLARALGVRPLVSVRGTASTQDVALQLGCDVVRGSATRLLRALAPDVLVVDDPDARAAARWIRAARRFGVAVASVHDLGIGCLDADLLIDGSIVQRLDGRRRPVAAGPSYAILDPGLCRHSHGVRLANRVVVSLGGGRRAALAWDIATAVAARAPEVQVRVIGGFISSGPPSGRQPAKNVIWVGASHNVADELARASVAVVGGGVSLYEACALGTPAVGVAVVPSQRPTVGGFTSRGAALGHLRSPVRAQRVAADALRLLREGRLRRLVRRAAQRLVDGQGAHRAAAAIARLVEGR
jgi:spore coat polysaccharide biosynthesis predicted glycosyltransferase SpsG